MAKRKKGLFNMLGNVLALLLVVGAVGLAVVWFNGGIDFSNLSNGKKTVVTYNGKTLENNTTVNLVWGIENRFDVSKASEYSVTILRADKSNFDFILGIGENSGYEQFSKLDDYTRGFNVKLYADYFIIDIPKDFSMSDLLSKMYGKAVSEVPDINFYENDYFIIRITSDGGTLDLDLKKHFIITLDRDGIIF